MNNMDKYLEKMVLVPEERWKQLLQNESNNRQELDNSRSDTDETPFPTEEEKNTSSSEKEISDNKLRKESNSEPEVIAPPGVPESGISDIDNSEVEEHPIKKLKKTVKKHKKETNKPFFKWKKLPGTQR
jgi:hypothetical protein